MQKEHKYIFKCYRQHIDSPYCVVLHSSYLPIRQPLKCLAFISFVPPVIVIYL